MKSRLVVSTITLALSTFGFTGVASASPNNSSTAYGTQTPYSLGIEALEGPTYTDLYVNLTPMSSGITTPDTLKKVQLKTFNQNGELVYTRNDNNGVASPNGTADIQLTDVVRHQPLQTLVQVQNSQTTDTTVLNATGVVLLRPELSVDSVDAPTTAYVNTSINVSAIVKELNGDLGANSTVQILNGDTVLDTANNVKVSAGGSAAVAFLLNFSQPGTYHLRALISNVQPGEYDATHNEKDFTIQVLQPDKTMQYRSYYDYYDYHDTGSSTGEYYYYFGDNYDNKGSFDQYELIAQTTDSFTPSGTFSLKLTSANGNVFTDTFSNFRQAYNGEYYAYDPTTGGHLWIHQSPYGTTLSYSQQGGYYVNSDNWYDYTNNTYSYGELFKASPGQLDGHFELPATSGIKYGGDFTVPLVSIPDYNYEDKYSWWGGYYDYSWSVYNRVQGYNSGLTSWN